MKECWLAQKEIEPTNCILDYISRRGSAAANPMLRYVGPVIHTHVNSTQPRLRCFTAHCFLLKYLELLWTPSFGGQVILSLSIQEQEGYIIAFQVAWSTEAVTAQLYSLATL